MGEAKRKKQKAEHLPLAELGRDLTPTEAVRMLTDHEHLTIIGRWDPAQAARRVLDGLILGVGPQLGVLLVRPYYAPSLARPRISLSGVVGSGRTYPDLFVAFLPDSAEHRAFVSAVIKLAAKQNGVEEHPFVPVEFKGRAPIVLLGDDQELEEAAALVCNTLSDINCGRADDWSFN
jgi:hypothetical protein